MQGKTGAACSSFFLSFLIKLTLLLLQVGGREHVQYDHEGNDAMSSSASLHLSLSLSPSLSLSLSDPLSVLNYILQDVCRRRASFRERAPLAVLPLSSTNSTALMTAAFSLLFALKTKKHLQTNTHRPSSLQESLEKVRGTACLNYCLPVSTTVCLPQLLFACLNYCLPVSTTVCLSQLLSACLNYCLPVSTTVCLSQLSACLNCLPVSTVCLSQLTTLTRPPPQAVSPECLR